MHIYIRIIVANPQVCQGLKETFLVKLVVLIIVMLNEEASKLFLGSKSLVVDQLHDFPQICLLW